MVREGKLKLDDRGCVYDPNKSTQDLENMPAELHPMEEFFNDGYHSEIMVSLDCTDDLYASHMDHFSSEWPMCES